MEDKKFFRIVKKSPPQDGDFIPTWFSNPRNINECQERGLSISEKCEDAQKTMKAFKRLGKYIYSGIIRYKVDGIVKRTPSSNNPTHRTWYPYVDTNEIEIFKVHEK